MDPMLYQELASRTECSQEEAHSRLTTTTIPIRICHALNGMSKEVGELQSLFEKWIYYGQLLQVDKMQEELGDVLWYAAELCNALELDMNEVMRLNIEKLKVRYPEKFTKEQALNRNIEAEHRAIEQ